MKRLHISSDRCTGCESCSLSCSFEHEGSFSLALSRIQIQRDESAARFTPRVCIQCNERSCVGSCPVDALSIDESTGAIRIDQNLCTGCRSCETACAWGGIHFVEGRTIPVICDLCGGQPRCIATCQLPIAIQFVEVEAGDAA